MKGKTFLKKIAIVLLGGIILTSCMKNEKRSEMGYAEYTTTETTSESTTEKILREIDVAMGSSGSDSYSSDSYNNDLNSGSSYNSGAYKGSSTGSSSYKSSSFGNSSYKSNSYKAYEYGIIRPTQKSVRNSRFLFSPHQHYKNLICILS